MSNPAVRVGRGRRSLGRWFVALLATVLLVVSGSGLVAFAQSGAGQSMGPRFVPAGAAMYVEARLDMPEGQSEALAQFMSAFPGFADEASFQMKIDEALQGMLADATDGELSFEQMRAFMTGEIGLGVMDLMTAAMSGEDPELIVGIAISDRAAAEEFVSALLEAGDVEATSETFGTTTIVSDDETAIAVHDDWILLSNTVDQVEAAIGALEGSLPSLAEDPEFVTAFGRLPDGRLGAAYVDLQSFSSFIELAGMMAGGQAGMELPTEEIMAQLPIDMTAYLAAEGDRMTLETFITPSPATQGVTEGESELATSFPADTQLYVETRALGTTLEGALSGMMATMDEEAMAQFGPVESILGTNIASFLDFVDDAAMGGSVTSDGVWLGIAAEVVEGAAATADPEASPAPLTPEERIERITSLLRIATADPEMGATLSESTVADTTVYTITLPMDEMGAQGMPVGLPETISYALTDDRLLIGTGDFVGNVLTGVADPLAQAPGYLDALGEDTMNAGVVYANVSALLAGVEPLLAMMGPEWQEIEPYATAIDRIVAVGNVDDEVISARMTVIVDS